VMENIYRNKIHSHYALTSTGTRFARIRRLLLMHRCGQ
jgi:hypothetical protein